jgi:glycosidase
MIFLDNHDLTRFYTYQKNDYERFKQGIGLLLTLRGVPQWYYGTEILMTGDGASHPEVRKDFPGGWAGDSLDLFQEKNRKGKTEEGFKFCQNLLNWRKTSSAIKSGKFLHFLPEKQVYTYFRIHKDQTVMVLVNGDEKPVDVSLSRFKDQIQKFEKAREVISGNSINLKQEKISIPAKGIWILDCGK